MQTLKSHKEQTVERSKTLLFNGYILKKHKIVIMIIFLNIKKHLLMLTIKI